MKPAVTIVTVCYRNPDDLADTLDKLEPLDRDAFELLVIDGSPDDSCARVAARHPRVRHLQGPDRGKYDAMNKGINAAQGDSLMFINSGDAIESPEALNRLVAESRAELANTLIYGDSIRVVGGERISVPAPAPGEANLRIATVPCHQSILIPAAFHRQNLYDDTMHFAADTKLIKRAFQSLPYRYVPRPIGVWTYGGASTSPASWRLLRTQIRELFEVVDLPPHHRLLATLWIVLRKIVHTVVGEERLQAIQARLMRRRLGRS